MVAVSNFNFNRFLIIRLVTAIFFSTKSSEYVHCCNGAFLFHGSVGDICTILFQMAHENGWNKLGMILTTYPSPGMILQKLLMFQKSCTTWDVYNLANNGINYLSIGAKKLLFGSFIGMNPPSISPSQPKRLRGIIHVDQTFDSHATRIGRIIGSRP